MNVLSWNIQAAKGVDEVTSVERIAGVIDGMGTAEVICCQEVLQEFSADGSVLIDQAAELASYFPEHTLHFGAAIDRLIDGKQVRFGNLTLSNLPVLSVAMHRLPQPAHKGSACMARQAIELVVEAADGRAVRVLSTHLEFFAYKQRKAQATYLRSTCRDATDRVHNPAKHSGANAGIYTVAPETLETILCGDLNLTTNSTEYDELNAGGENRVLHDAWTELYPNDVHAPTCGIFDHQQWQEGSHCRDYFFVTPDLLPRLKEISVNTETDASDHQPLRLGLG